MAKAAQKISIYSNPTTGILHLIGVSDPVKVEVFSLDGRLIKSFHALKSSVSLEDVPEGKYIIRIQIVNQIMTKKVSIG
jgi:hypothetical protein